MTAVSFADFIFTSDEGVEYGLLSIGTESGRVEIWTAQISDNESAIEAKLLYAVPGNDCHFDSVTKIAWKPVNCNGHGSSSPPILTFATCGKDCGVRVFNLQMI